jgi:hypothetical protein
MYNAPHNRGRSKRTEALARTAVELSATATGAGNLAAELLQMQQWVTSCSILGCRRIRDRCRDLVLRVIQMIQLPPCPRFPGESRDLRLPWAPAFAGDAGLKRGASLLGKSCE